MIRIPVFIATAWLLGLPSLLPGADILDVGNEGFVTTDDGARLYYRVVGTGSPIVIVPAGFFLERDLARLARRRTLVFYDMRGRGRSSPVADSRASRSTSTLPTSKQFVSTYVPNVSFRSDGRTSG